MKSRNLMHASVALWLGLVAGATMSAEVSGIRVEDAWVREPPVETTSAAAYFTLHNDGTRPAVLVGATSPTFKQVSMHESLMQGGQWIMDQRAKVAVEPGKSVEFKPGGLHLMLEGGGQPIRGGQEIQLTLLFQDGHQATVVAGVRRQR